MAQEFEVIIDLLKEMRRVNNANSDSFDRLLTSISRKIDLVSENTASAELLKAYISELSKEVEEKYSTTLFKFNDIESALKSIFEAQEEHVKTHDMQELFDIFSKNLNNFYAESKDQKALLSQIEQKLESISNDKSDKEEVLKTINALKIDFERLNQESKDSIDKVNLDVRTIISDLADIDQQKINRAMQDQLEIISQATNDIVKYLKYIDEKDTNMEKLLDNVVTTESLKVTQGVIDSLIEKTDEISKRITNIVEKSDIENIQKTYDDLELRLEKTSTAEDITKVLAQTDDILTDTEKVKQALAQVSQNIESLPTAKILEESIKSLYLKFEGLLIDIRQTGSEKTAGEMDSKVSSLQDEFSTIKNIIADLNDAVSDKVLTAIGHISFANESYDIKNHVSKMLAQLPQKDDIEKILLDSENNNKIMNELLEKTDKLADKLDTLPTHQDMAALNSNQLGLVENLQEVASKSDIENLSAKSDEIEKMIDKLNFDDEFGHIYDKTASIEDWLIESKVKENTQKLLSQLADKAEQNVVLEILEVVKKIAIELEELTQNTDVRKVNHTVAEIYSMIDELKIDFMNTQEMHNDSIIIQLSELQKSISSIVSGEEFNNFIEDIKDFSKNIINNTDNLTSEMEKNYGLQQDIIGRLENIDLSTISDAINKNMESHLADISEKVDRNQSVQNDILEKIDNIDLSNISDAINSNMKTHLEELKELSQTAIDNSKNLSEQVESNRNAQNNILEKIDNLDFSNITDSITSNMKTHLDELKELSQTAIDSSKDLSEQVESNRSAQNDILERINNLDFSNISESISNNIKSFATELKEFMIGAIENASFKKDETTEPKVATFDNEEYNKLQKDILAKIETLDYGDISDSLKQNFADIENNLNELAKTVENNANELTDKIEKNNELYSNIISKLDKISVTPEDVSSVDSADISSLTSDLNELSKNISDKTNEIKEIISNNDFRQEILDRLNNINCGALTDTFENKFNTMSDEIKNLSDSIVENTNNLKELSENISEQLKNIKISESPVIEIPEITDYSQDLKDISQLIDDKATELSAKIEKSYENHQEVIDKIGDIDFSYDLTLINKNLENYTNDLENAINSRAGELSENVDNIDKKLSTLSDFIENSTKFDEEGIKNSISELKEIIENKKSNYDEIEKAKTSNIEQIESYINEVKTAISNTDNSLSANVKELFDDLELELAQYKAFNENQFTKILEKLNNYQQIPTDNNIPTASIKYSVAEIEGIREQIEKLAASYEVLLASNHGKDTEVSSFVINKFEDINKSLLRLSDNVENGMQEGFAYNAELIEEKASLLLDFIKELRHASTQNIELYERLTVTDNKLMDLKQELELVNTDITNTLNTKTDTLISELEPIKTLVEDLRKPKDTDIEVIKDKFEILHDSIKEELAQCNRYSKSNFDKLEDTYYRISDNITQTENNIKDFILSDIDSVIRKFEEFKLDIESSLNNIVPPDVSEMKEFHDFLAEIREFREDQKELLANFKTSINDTLENQHEEIKSMLTVAVNNEEIIQAIEKLQETFKTRIEELKTIQKENAGDEFGANQFEQAFDDDNINEKIIKNIKYDFSKFSKEINDLTNDNKEIKNALLDIREKIDNVTILKSDTSGSFLEDNETQSDTKALSSGENFDFIKAFDLLKQDIQKLKLDIEKVINEEKIDINNISSDPDISNERLLMALNNKIELLSKKLSKDWLGETNEYLADDKIYSILDGIKNKVDSLDSSEWVEEIKQSIAQLNVEATTDSTTNKEIQNVLSAISSKIDILAGTNNNSEELKDLIQAIDNKVDILAASNDSEELIDMITSLNEKVDIIATDTDSEEIVDMISNLSEKVDILAETDHTNSIEDIKYTLSYVDEKIDTLKPVEEKVQKLSESDAKMTTMLETLNHKIDIIAEQESDFDTLEDLDDIKRLILVQTEYIEKLENNEKTEAVKKCLDELTQEVNNLNSNLQVNQDNADFQKALKDMKESIMAAVVTIFEQVSFYEESEDIKDFVEEKTDVINQNLEEVTKQLKQITNSYEAPNYSYTMQDIESDLAKLRIAINEYQTNEQEYQTTELSNISDSLNRISSNVEELQNSLTQDEIKDIRSEITFLREETQRLLINSDESYNALNSGFEGFSRVITDHLSNKVDRVTRLLEKSSASDKVMRQALIYMGEWIDSASESMNKISTNSEEIVDMKTAIESLRTSIPEQTDILNSIEEKFDEQQERLSFLEKQIIKLAAFEDRFEQQQERIDRLEMTIEKVLSAVEEIDDSKVTRKIDRIDKQISKLSSNIEKLASYVD